MALPPARAVHSYMVTASIPNASIQFYKVCSPAELSSIFCWRDAF